MWLAAYPVVDVGRLSSLGHRGKVAVYNCLFSAVNSCQDGGQFVLMMVTGGKSSA